jgi:phosphoglycolate phosphatase-like HAD superfamily hydrolase
MIGDYLFDIQAGLQAGARTALFARGRDRASLAGTDLADLVFDSFDCPQLASWLDKPI